MNTTNTCRRRAALFGQIIEILRFIINCSSLLWLYVVIHLSCKDVCKFCKEAVMRTLDIFYHFISSMHLSTNLSLRSCSCTNSQVPHCEPLTTLQRLTEELEYSNLLDKAVNAKSDIEEMAYVAAFSISVYSSSVNRDGKPFNPIFGETYECDRRQDKGWRSIAEQVSGVFLIRLWFIDFKFILKL